MPYKFGLRVVRPAATLHWSSMRLKYRATAPSTITSVDYLTALPAWLGMMYNDQEGDCLDAMFYHSDQARTQFAAGACITQPDYMADRLYRAITGYDGTPQKDVGSDPKESFDYVIKNGLPRVGIPDAKLIAAIEIDPRNEQDVLDAMDACCGLAVGISVPQSLEANMGKLIWDYVPGETTIEGGHEIFVGKHTLGGNYGLVSWGQKNYEMTPNFWQNYVNQCTALIFDDWITGTGKTPLGMNVDQWLTEMMAIQSGQVP